MFKSRMNNYNWMHIAFASLALAFVSSSSVRAVGVDEPDPDEASVTADDTQDDAAEPGQRGRRGFRRDRVGDGGFGPGPRDGAEGRRGMGDGKRPGAMLWNRMTEEEREEVRAFVAEYYPEVSESLEANDGEDGKGRLDRRHARMLPEILRMHQLSKEDSDMFAIKITEQKSRFELRGLVREYRQATDDETKQQLSSQIKPLVEAAFDAQQARMEQEVTHLEKRLEGLRAHISKRAENRDTEIEQAFSDVLEGKRVKGDRFNRDDDGGRNRRRPRGPAGLAPSDRRPPPPALDDDDDADMDDTESDGAE